MNDTEQITQLEQRNRLVSRSRKDSNIIGRKFNGQPYLKLKMVKPSPRHKIRQLLRGFVPLDELRPAPTTGKEAG